jgi:hypothetical protein
MPQTLCQKQHPRSKRLLKHWMALVTFEDMENTVRLQSHPQGSIQCGRQFPILFFHPNPPVSSS